MRPMRLFISGELTNGGTVDTKTALTNVHKAILAEVECMRKGHHVFVPHLSFLTNEVAKEEGVDIPYEQWMATDDAFLQVCDGLVFIGSSKGSEIELARARELGLKVFNSVDEVPVAESFVASSYKDSPY